MCTSCSSTSGGPSSISSDFVPGRILRDALWSVLLLVPILLYSSIMAAPGDTGPVWSSAMGGGLGSRGELAGECSILDMLQLIWDTTQVGSLHITRSFAEICTKCLYRYLELVVANLGVQHVKLGRLELCR